MNKIVVILIFIITITLGMTWFNAMGFFENTASGDSVGSNLFNLTTTIGWITTSFLFMGLALLGAFVSNFLKINAFGIIAFTELFWLPYATTVSIFKDFLMQPEGMPVAFLGIFTIFTTIMALLYIYTMIEWSRIPGGL
jgi:hypothetical protein